MLTKRSFAVAGHRTSVALEDEFWAALTAIAVADGTTLSGLVARVDGIRGPAQSLASALRILALQNARRERVSEEPAPGPNIPAVD
jgi:predicted DNA-binding ribbon-helix-helix protein